MHNPQYPTRFVNLAAARAQYGDRAERLGHWLWASDPLADAAVASLANSRRRDGWKRIEKALRHGVDSLEDCEPELRAFFLHAEQIPMWVDWKVLEHAGKLFFRGGFLSGMVLGVKSLVYGYCSPGGNKPLVFSGRLETQASRRLQETVAFVHAVCSPGGMKRGAPGYQITLKVRLMHAKVRRLIETSDRWKPEQWGTPINQHDMLATTLLFSLVLIRGLRMTGFSISQEESESYLSLWRYIGYLMGVEEELLFGSERQAERLAEMIHITQGPPDDDSRALTHALMLAASREAPTEALREQARKRIPFSYGLCRALLGEELSDQLQLPRNAWRHSLSAVHALVGTFEKARIQSSAISTWQLEMGRKHWDMLLQRGLSHGPPMDFAPPQNLRANAHS